MSDKTYLVVSGFVQKFGDKPAVERKDVNGSTVIEFTIKAIGTQKLLKVSAWADSFEDFTVNAGDFVAVDGEYKQREGTNGTVFHNLTAYSVVVSPQVAKKEREVVNSGGSSAVSSETPPF